jgi:NH3-dependent NAD+ synthetase
MPVLNADALIDERVEALRAYHDRAGLPRAELDLSGGIDSAVMAGLLTLALGSANLTMVYSSINSGGETQRRASVLAEALGAPLVIHDLTAAYEAMTAAMIDNLEAAGWDRATIEARIAADRTIMGSIRSCLRAPLGRGYLRFTGNGIRHGTGNECEDRWLRFYQKGGDGEVDTNPVAMLAKGEIYQLAHGLGLRLDAVAAYQAILLALPTPELWGTESSHTDEDEIGSYLGLEDSGHTFYSYVDPGTGAYTHVGLIERLARFADGAPALFEDATSDGGLTALIADAAQTPCFVGVAPGLVDRLLRAARGAERRTRHKFNPACPSLGDRESLVAAGILTDELPTLGSE